MVIPHFGGVQEPRRIYEMLSNGSSIIGQSVGSHGHMVMVATHAPLRIPDDILLHSRYWQNSMPGAKFPVAAIAGAGIKGKGYPRFCAFESLRADERRVQADVPDSVPGPRNIWYEVTFVDHCRQQQKMAMLFIHVV